MQTPHSGSTMLLFVAAFCSLNVLCSGYASGPPINEPRVCLDMFPTGHKAQAQTTTLPYKITTNSDCYKAGQEVKVVMHVINTTLPVEGLFIQARKQSGSALEVAVGEFRVNDPALKTLDCNSNNKSAVSHSKEDKATKRIVYWTAPQGLTEDIKFSATMLAHKAVFWTNVKSPVLKFNSTCVGNSSPGSGSSLVASVLAAIIALAFRA